MDGHSRGEGVQAVGERGVVAANEAPLVLLNVVNFTRHIVITSYDVDFVLDEKGFVADTKLVHLVEGFPALGGDVKEVDFAVSVCVFATD